MKMLIIENLETGRAECGENVIPFPVQEILVEGEDFRIHEVESEELALSWLDREVGIIRNLAIDDKAIVIKVREALELTGWNARKAAKKYLGISPRKLSYLCKQHNIKPPDHIKTWNKPGGRNPKLELKRGTG